MVNDEESLILVEVTYVINTNNGEEGKLQVGRQFTDFINVFEFPSLRHLHSTHKTIYSK